jgi:hypothetical protein
MSDTDINNCRDYLGEEIAFFFLFSRYLCKALAVPAILGFLFRLYITFVVDEFASENFGFLNWVRLAFGLFMVFWGSIFVGKYRQEESRWILRWGMKGVSEHTEQLKTYNSGLEGTYRLMFYRALTPILSGIVIFLVVKGVQFITALRIRWREEDRMFIFGLMRGEELAGYMITAQILSINYLWTEIAEKLCNLENHRTKLKREQERIMKIFYVKLVSTFLPFLFTAFVKRYYDPCGLDAEKKESCLPELRRDLFKYFSIYVAMEIITVFYYTLRTRRKVNRELSNAEAAGLLEQEVTIGGEVKTVPRIPTYMDIQAKSFPCEEIASKYMELMTGFALICFFGQVLPVMAFLYFVANMLEARLLAYLYTRVTQRSKPQRAEGVGPWLYIFEFITHTAIIVVPALSVFELHPLRNYPELTEFQMFLVIEHFLIILNLFTHSRFHDDPHDVEEAVKFHSSLFDYLFSGKHVKPVLVPNWETLRGIPPAFGPKSSVIELENEESKGDRWREDDDHL